MRGVGEQRERVGQHARDDLDRHEREDQPERDAEPAAVGVRRRRVRVGVAVGVGVRVPGHRGAYSGSFPPFFGLSQSLSLPAASEARSCTRSTPNSLKILRKRSL